MPNDDSTPSDPTVTVDAARLGDAITVLSDAAKSFELTGQRRSNYRALLVSADLAVIGLLAGLLTLVIDVVPKWRAGGFAAGLQSEPGTAALLAFIVSGAIFFLGLAGGLVFLILNIPLVYRTWRQRSSLKRRGVVALSRYLWKFRRRRKLLSRLRGVVIVSLGIVFSVIAAYAVAFPQDQLRVVLGVFFGLAAFVLLSAWRLRAIREQLELAADAKELVRALKAFRTKPDPEHVTIPRELLERAGRFESVQIARERESAIQGSAGDFAKGIAIRLDPDAIEQRRRLSLEERVGFEDLAASLSLRKDEVAVAGPFTNEDPLGPSSYIARAGQLKVEFARTSPDTIQIRSISRS